MLENSFTLYQFAYIHVYNTTTVCFVQFLSMWGCYEITQENNDNKSTSTEKGVNYSQVMCATICASVQFYMTCFSNCLLK